MGEEIYKEVERALERLFPLFIEKHSKIYSKEELLTRDEFLEAIKKMDERFEASERRFEQLIKEMHEQREDSKREFQRIDDRWTVMFRELVGMKKGLGSLDDRAGHKTEKLILSFWREVIKERFGKNIDNIRELVIIKSIGGKKREIKRQFDLFIDGDPPYLFEMKFCPTIGDIDDFISKSADFEKVKEQIPELVLVSQVLRPSVRRYAEKQGVHLIEPAEDPPEVWNTRTTVSP